ncbi:MAG: hypothetical protein GY795_49645 [Desulfobacterales bacterium]|nr:hypothetical protein [Desulfobacterales bacterium]
MKKIFMSGIIMFFFCSLNASASVVINEFMADNTATVSDQNGEYDDWIELYNSSDSAVSLSGYYLTDDATDLTQWIFPDISVPAHGYLVIWADSDEEQEGLHAGFKLSASGETLLLVNPDQTVADEITFGEQASDISTGRYPDGTGSFIAMNPTFAAANQGEATIPGDIDGDLDIDMADAVSALKALAGITQVIAGTKADINSDSKIGLQEAIYIIRKVSEITTVQRPDGWTEETHGNLADPNYDVVFVQDGVMRLDLTIDSADWQAMMDDMTDMYGEFGKSGDNTEIPPEAIEACVYRTVGDQCTISMPNREVNGICTLTQDTLECKPDNTPPVPRSGLETGADQNQGEPGMGGFSDRNPIWKPCTVNFMEKTWLHVGVRFKGNSSLKSSWERGIYKLPMRFDFDQFEDDYPEIDNQRFYGFKKLAMSSGFNDNSLVREKVAADIFRDAGVPAAMTAFYRLFIDYGNGPVYFGLYTMVEVPGDPMLEKYYSDDSGNLYKPEGTGAKFASFDQDSFDKETNEDEADWSDVIAVFDALHTARENQAVWRTGLEKVFNANGFLKWLAINTVIQNWDCYGQAPHNYYLYTNPADNIMQWIPWDHNEAINGQRRNPLSLSLTTEEVGNDWPLITYLMDDPEYRALYISFTEETINGAFNVSDTHKRYQVARTMIEPYVVGDEGEIEGYTHLSDSQAFSAEFEYLLNHVEQRRDDVIQFLGSGTK